MFVNIGFFPGPPAMMGQQPPPTPPHPPPQQKPPAPPSQRTRRKKRREKNGHRRHRDAALEQPAQAEEMCGVCPSEHPAAGCEAWEARKTASITMFRNGQCLICASRQHNFRRCPFVQMRA